MANEQGRPAAKTGCLGTMVGALVAAIVVGMISLLFFSPWALHMGGRLTPVLRWHGYGKLGSADGVAYILFLDLNLSKAGADTSRSSNLNGSAKLCGPRLGTVSYALSGTVYRAWLSADGKRMVLHLYSPKNAQKLDFSLEGSWQGQQLVLSDRGSLAAGFNADGSPRGVGVGMYRPRKESAAVIEYGSRSDFEALCRNVK